MIPVAAVVVIIVILVIAGLVAAGRTFRVVQQYEKGIVYRLSLIHISEPTRPY